MAILIKAYGEKQAVTAWNPVNDNIMDRITSLQPAGGIKPGIYPGFSASSTAFDPLDHLIFGKYAIYTGLERVEANPCFGR